MTGTSCRRAIGADLIATLEGFSREDVDAFAVASQRKAEHAWAAGLLEGRSCRCAI
jgi:acetyl-CoA C-acetyltransferase